MFLKEGLKETKQRKGNEETLAKPNTKTQSDKYLQRVPYNHHLAFAAILQSFGSLPQDLTSPTAPTEYCKTLLWLLEDTLPFRPPGEVLWLDFDTRQIPNFMRVRIDHQLILSKHLHSIGRIGLQCLQVVSQILPTRVHDFLAHVPYVLGVHI